MKRILTTLTLCSVIAVAAFAQGSPQNGMRDKAGAELASAKLDAEFHKPIKIKQLYPKIVVKGKDKVGDKEVYVVEATPVESSVETWYFDTQTGLILRQDMERESAQ